MHAIGSENAVKSSQTDPRLRPQGDERLKTRGTAGIAPAKGLTWIPEAPTGMVYWEHLAEILDREPVHSRDMRNSQEVALGDVLHRPDVLELRDFFDGVCENQSFQCR
ncbi:MAG: hypothetical protein ACI9W2_004375 [Gammaproteobacteria bacterium]|jgi:hypothetical protein